MRKRNNGKADWFQVKAGLDSHFSMHVIATACHISTNETLACLYRIAAWFLTHGKYGVMHSSPDIVDIFLQVPGFGAALIDVDWMRHEDGALILRGFTNVSALRKMIGSKLRKKILGGAVCAACQSSENLQIDHITPVSRGGHSGEENLQPLCETCNTNKGQRTMAEFMEARANG